jgi:dihydroneopterin aldolase
VRVASAAERPLLSTESAGRSSRKGQASSHFGSRPGSFLATSERVDDQVLIERLEIFAHIGVPDEERAVPQRLTLNIAFWPIRQAGEIQDEIVRAVNYATVCAETRKFVTASRNKLIETLADALAGHLLATFEIRRISIELRKYILPDVEFVSVIVTRERSEK